MEKNQNSNTEKEKMIAGELYNAEDPELKEGRKTCRVLLRKYNASTDDEEETRLEILTKLLGKTTNNKIKLEPPFYCDYGYNIFAGENFYMNFDCVILDCARVDIGDNVLCGPKVQIYTATHPLEAEERIKGAEFAKPIKIGNNVWIGGGAIICPGVTIGDNTTIGAGSVVTKDIPSDVLAAGVPCKVIKKLKE
jgi:maltose O-acetyltransferase